MVNRNTTEKILICEYCNEEMNKDTAVIVFCYHDGKRIEKYTTIIDEAHSNCLQRTTHFRNSVTYTHVNGHKWGKPSEKGWDKYFKRSVYKNQITKEVLHAQWKKQNKEDIKQESKKKEKTIEYLKINFPNDWSERAKEMRLI